VAEVTVVTAVVEPPAPAPPVASVSLATEETMEEMLSTTLVAEAATLVAEAAALVALAAISRAG
jgi:hypothetical protein